MQILACRNGEQKLVIDAMKLITKLGLEIETLTAEDVRNALINLSEEERENLFTECSIFNNYFDIEKASRPTLLTENCFKMPKERDIYEIFERNHPIPRVPAEIRKDLRYEKNPMRKTQLNQELTASCRYWKYRK